MVSVAAQVYHNVEHIVVDGGSLDDTVSILAEMRRPNMRWISEPDEGQGHALNKAFKLSDGEVIGWLNSDDVYMDRYAVAAAVEVFRSYPECGVVYGHGAYLDQRSRVQMVRWVPTYSPRLLRRVDFLVQPAVFVRRSLLGDDFVNQELQFALDYELWLRLSRVTLFRRVSRVLAGDRVHSGQKRTALRAVQDQELQKVTELRGVSKDIHATERWLHLASRFAGLRPGLIRKSNMVVRDEGYSTRVLLRNHLVRRRRRFLGWDG